MFFKFQNFSNMNAGSPFSMAVKPLVSLGVILIVLGLLITAYPQAFAGVVAFLLYFIAAICLFLAFKIWRVARLFNAAANQDQTQEQDNSGSVKVDVTVIE